MFVKLYHYKIKKNDFQKWKTINNRARKIYKKYGNIKSMRLVQKTGKFITITELDFYRSRNEFVRITRKLNTDSSISVLFQEFLSIIHNKKFTEEEFYAV